jgi:hypothetical protein
MGGTGALCTKEAQLPLQRLEKLVHFPLSDTHDVSMTRPLHCHELRDSLLVPYLVAGP